MFKGCIVCGGVSKILTLILTLIQPDSYPDSDSASHINPEPDSDFDSDSHSDSDSDFDSDSHPD